MGRILMSVSSDLDHRAYVRTYVCTYPGLAAAMNDELMIKPHIDMILAESEMYMYEEMPVKYVLTTVLPEFF